MQAIATSREGLTITHHQLREQAVQAVIGVGRGLTKIQHI